MPTNVCQQCGKNFETPNRKKMYCSPECRRAADSLIIEFIYKPNIERQIECLCALLDIPYTRPD
jgi:hypothetical protein